MNNEMSLPYIALMAALCHIGYFGHVLTELLKMVERMPDSGINIGWMIRNRPYRLTLSYLGAVAGFAILWHIKDLSPLTAIGIGYLSSDVFTEVGRETSRRFNKP